MSSANSILSASSDTCDTAGYDHHPEHARCGSAMRGSGQGDSLNVSVSLPRSISLVENCVAYQNQEESCRNDTEPSAVLVDAESEEQHTDDFTDED